MAERHELTFEDALADLTVHSIAALVAAEANVLPICWDPPRRDAKGFPTDVPICSMPGL